MPLGAGLASWGMAPFAVRRLRWGFGPVLLIQAYAFCLDFLRFLRIFMRTGLAVPWHRDRCLPGAGVYTAALRAACALLAMDWAVRKGIRVA